MFDTLYVVGNCIICILNWLLKNTLAILISIIHDDLKFLNNFKKYLTNNLMMWLN